MGEKYALLVGENAAVAAAIREHYMPTSQPMANCLTPRSVQYWRWLISWTPLVPLSVGLIPAI